jgi:glutamate synthase domain-containing protein 1
MLPKKTKSFYICSLHPRTIVYKGQLSSPQVWLLLQPRSASCLNIKLGLLTAGRAGPG